MYVNYDFLFRGWITLYPPEFHLVNIRVHSLALRKMWYFSQLFSLNCHYRHHNSIFYLYFFSTQRCNCYWFWMMLGSPTMYFHQYFNMLLEFPEILLKYIDTAQIGDAVSLLIPWHISRCLFFLHLVFESIWVFYTIDRRICCTDRYLSGLALESVASLTVSSFFFLFLLWVMYGISVFCSYFILLMYFWNLF